MAGQAQRLLADAGAGAYVLVVAGGPLLLPPFGSSVLEPYLKFVLFKYICCIFYVSLERL